MLFFRLAEKKVVKINPSSTASEVWASLCLDNYLTARFGFLNSSAYAAQSKKVFLNWTPHNLRQTYPFTLKTHGLYQVQLFFPSSSADLPAALLLIYNLFFDTEITEESRTFQPPCLCWKQEGYACCQVATLSLFTLQCYRLCLLYVCVQSAGAK